MKTDGIDKFAEIVDFPYIFRSLWQLSITVEWSRGRPPTLHQEYSEGATQKKKKYGRDGISNFRPLTMLNTGDDLGRPLVDWYV